MDTDVKMSRRRGIDFKQKLIPSSHGLGRAAENGGKNDPTFYNHRIFNRECFYFLTLSNKLHLDDKISVLVDTWRRKHLIGNWRRKAGLPTRTDSRVVVSDQAKQLYKILDQAKHRTIFLTKMSGSQFSKRPICSPKIFRGPNFPGAQFARAQSAGA